MSRQLDGANARLDDNNRQIELLTEQIRIMNQRHFGRRSESDLSDMDGQPTLFDSFNEVEATAKSDTPEPSVEEIIIPSHKRSKSKGKREELAEKFPNGYKELPVEIHKRLHIILETFIVDEHHVRVYASKNNDGTIVRAGLRVFLSDGNI